VVTAMLGRFRRVLELRLPPELARSPERLRATITLASLVQKETPDPAERPVIAGVFARRLERNILLECDPTVIYANRLVRRSISRSSGPITRSELAADSPYNTYLHAGLPPGPICSPGLVSIRAALNPTPGQSLYFVSNNRGGHVFANTLQEHQRNVTRYRREVAALRRPPAGNNEGADQPGSTSHPSARPSGRQGHRPSRSNSGQEEETAHP